MSFIRGPTTRGFDYYFGIPASLDMDPYLYFENDHVVEKPTAHTDGKNSPRAQLAGYAHDSHYVIDGNAFVCIDDDRWLAWK